MIRIVRLPLYICRDCIYVEIWLTPINMFFISEDVQRLQLVADNLIHNSIRLSTRKTYNSAQKRYLDFCTMYTLCPLPATQQVLLLYIAYLYEEKLCYSTVNVYLAAIRSLHIMQGHANPLDGDLMVKQALPAFQIERNIVQQKLPITFSILSKIQIMLNTQPHSHIVWAAMTLAFFGCLRSAELTVPSQQSYDSNVNLSLSDVKIYNNDQNEEWLTVFIKRSKTDKCNKGVHVYLGCTSHKVCAHCAIKQLLSQRSYNTNGYEPLFLYPNGLVLTKHLFLTQTRLLLSMLGYNASSFTGHSYRSGSATSAAGAGMSDWEIKLLGRWSSNAYQRYIRTSPTFLISFSKRLTTTSKINNVFNFRNPYITKNY